MFHRDCQHHRHRHLHEPWFSIERHSVRVRFADALGRGRNRSSLWRALLWRTECRVTAVRRRVSFSVADLSPSARIHGGVCFPGTRIFGAAFAVALVFVMYSYSGWNAAVYVTSEIKQPEKNVPRSLLVGTGVVIVVYVLLNAIFLATTPVQELKGQLDVALIAGKHIFGTNGGQVAGAVICLGLVSAISSMTWIGPRVSMSMGEDHWLLRLLGRKNPHGIPTHAIVLQLFIVNLLLLTRSFESVVQYTQFSLLLCSLFTVVGVIVLRKTRPEIARPYRVWGYPLPPIIFAVITLWMMTYLMLSNTIESLAGLATALVGLLLYFCASKRFHRSQ